jgi:pilus assembly protein Flp/PilA
MINRIRMILSDKGASAVEYGLLVAGIAALVVLAVFTLGGTVNTTFEDVNTAVSTDGNA